MLNPNATEFNPYINHTEKAPLDNNSITTTTDTKPKPKSKKKKKTVTEKQNTTNTTMDKEIKLTTTAKEHKNKKESKNDNKVKNKTTPSNNNNNNNNHTQTSKKKSIPSSSTNSDNIQSSSQLQNKQQPNDKQQPSTNRRKKQQQTPRKKSSHHVADQTNQDINMEQPTNFITLQHTIDPIYSMVQHPTKKTIAHGYDRYVAWIERSLQTYETITLVGSDPALADLISLISIVQLKGIGTHHELATFTTDGPTSCIQVKLHRI